MHAAPPLTEVVKHPHVMASLDLAAWDALVPSARAAGLLARLAREAEAVTILDDIPVVVRQHLENARLAADSAARAIRWEVNRVTRAMRAADVSFMLLKGAAYLEAGHPFALTRPVSDVDILVRREQLDATEQTLREHGWRMEQKDAYDDHYYRAWMHELPPFRHHLRGGIVDVHHALVPPVSPRSVDVGLLWEAAAKAPGRDCVLIPSINDQIVHCAIHGMYLGEAEDTFRCALDLHDLMIAAYEQTPCQLAELPDRAAELGALDALLLGLDIAQRLFDTGIPAEYPKLASMGPALRTSGALFREVAVPGPLGSNRQRLYRRCLQLRGHLHRMKPALLFRHTVHKLGGRLRA